jgi:L-aspartate oxidase
MRRPAWQVGADVVVIGTGVAGLAAGLAAYRRGSSVLVLSKARETATHYAQGGIAVVLPGSDDSVETHVDDTLAAGGGLCDQDAVRSIVGDGFRAVADLVGDGARFDETTPGRWALTREGGHTRNRIIHAGGDATGAEVQRALNKAAAILDIRPNHVAQQVLCGPDGVTGVLVVSDDGPGIVHAPTVILATGGRDRPCAMGGLAGQRPGVHPVPPDHAVRCSHPGSQAADHRSAARRGRETG